MNIGDGTDGRQNRNYRWGSGGGGAGIYGGDSRDNITTDPRNSNGGGAGASMNLVEMLQATQYPILIFTQIMLQLR